MTTFASSRHARALSVPNAFVPVVTITLDRGDISQAFTPSSGQFAQDGRRALVWGGQVSINLPTGSPWLPTSPADLLTPFGTIATVEAGVKLADGTEETVGYGVYVVTAARAQKTGSSQIVSLDLSDLGIRVADYRFESPSVVAAGDVADVVNAVILDRLGVDPGLAASGETVGATLFGNDPAKNPWAELQDVAASRGLRLRYDRDGALSLTAAPSYAGDFPTVIEGYLAFDIAFESRPPNVVVARGEAVDGAIPAGYVAMDADEASPTYAGVAAGDSAYGRITRFYASPYLYTDAQAQAAAESILARMVGAGASRDITRSFDPLTDIDDLVAIDGIPLAVDAVTLDLGGTTVLSAREVVV